MAGNTEEEGRKQGRSFETLVCHARLGLFLVGRGKSLKGFNGKVMWADFGLYLEGEAERDPGT